MKTKRIIGTVLTAVLLIFGTVAYAHWNDYGDHGYYGTGYGYCGDGYNVRVNYPAVNTYAPSSEYWQGAGSSYSNDERSDVRSSHSYDDMHNYGTGWMGHIGHDRMGPRGCCW